MIIKPFKKNMETGVLLTHRQHPVLTHLNNRSFKDVSILAEDKAYLLPRIEALERVFSAMTDRFKKRIRVFSLPFLDAFEAARDKLNLPELYASVESQSGTVIFGKTAICYEIVNESELSVRFFAFTKQALMAVGWIAPSQDKSNTQISFWGTSYLYHPKNKLADSARFSASIIQLINFLKYADVQTKFLPANKRVKDFTCKYVNQTSFDIEYVNSTWFTNLVKSDGFKVRGHFRLQPSGTGRKERKLIWINEFSKSGYTAPARKLNEFSE